MVRPQPSRAHVICGGYPPGSPAGHDMDYARLRILELLQEDDSRLASVSNDFIDVEKWLPMSQLMITYVAGPFLDDEQNAFVRDWLRDGGRWLALHGSSGGKAARTGEGRRRRMVKTSHHETLGGFFINHPPMTKFEVTVANPGHPLMRGLPPSFEVIDEPYMIEIQDPDCEVLLTSSLGPDPSPEGFGFEYDEDSSLMDDGTTRVVGYTRGVGNGGVTYFTLGHCHSPLSNSQPFVDASITADGTSPATLRGPWETEEYQTLLRNAIEWGLGNGS
ncbi:MAG: ThuA domain-containing protein [Chloroflexi bacterium]|nr:ThuA domain-containing protein [Chloroflexota bacterium]